MPQQSVYGNKSHLPAIFLTTFFVVTLVLIVTIEIRNRHQETLAHAEKVLSTQTTLAGSKLDGLFDKTLGVATTIADDVSRATVVPINLDYHYSDARQRAPWIEGLALVAPELGASSFAGSPPTGIPDNWTESLPPAQSSVSFWRPQVENEAQTPFGVIAPVGGSPALLIVWINVDSLLQEAIRGPIPLKADQLILLDISADFVAGISNDDGKFNIPKSVRGWSDVDRASLATPIYSSALNGKDRLLAIHPLVEAPFAMTLALPVSAALAPWYRALPTYLLLIFAPAAVGIVCAVLFVREAQRKDRINRSLLHSKHRYEMAVSAAKCGVWDWDLEGRQVYWSSAMFRLLGYADPPAIRSFDEIIDTIHPRDKATFDGLIADMEAASSDYDLTLRLKRADGRWAWVRLKGHSIREESLWAKRFIGVALDVTGERQVQEQLAETEQRLRETVESLEESFLLADSNGHTILSNKCHRQLASLLTSDDRDIIGAQSNPKPFDTREIKLRDGRWFQLNQQVTRSGGIVQVGSDVTRLKKQERMLKDSQAVLMASVDHIKKSRAQLKHQTRELADMADRYAIEKKRAQESSRSKSEFLANMSHELRTPLNAIIGFSEMMMSEIYGTLGDEKYRVYASDIFESGQHLLAMIEDILEMSRIDAGRLELVRSHINLEEVVRETLQVVEIRARDSGIRITTDLARLPSIYVDPQAIRQVLLQLLSNAIKFTPENGSVHLTGNFTNTAITVTVSDNGIGIPQDKIQRLGEPFEVVEKQDVRSQEGKGLGLALARSLIELHGGTLTIDSDEGSGTTVSIQIPVEQKLKPQKVEDAPVSEPEAQIVNSERKALGGR